MILSKRINGFELRYVVLDPQKDDIQVAFSIGSSVKQLGEFAGADLAINFNYADNITGTPIGRVIVDGQTVIQDIPKTIARDELYMTPDRSLHVGKAPENALWAVQGSPPLLRNGKNVVHSGIARDQLGTDIWIGQSIRTAAGLTADGRLVLVRTIDPVHLSELTDIMLELGCVDALNGDGGGSSYFYPHDNGWGRKMGVAIVANMKEVPDLDKPTLIIDPGHGGKDPGGGSSIFYDPTGFYEKDLVLKISLYQYERFKELGVPVAITRTDDRYLSPDDRTRIVRESGAKYCISNHINAAGATTARGVETIHSIFSNGQLAHAILNAIVSEGMPKRRVFCKQGANNQDYYFMHRQTGSVETVIVEYGFATNSSDSKLLQDNWQRYAESVVRVFCQFIGHIYDAPSKEMEVEESLKVQGKAKVVVNGDKESEGVIIDGRVYIPVRFVSENLGAKVAWDNLSKTASIKKGG